MESENVEPRRSTICFQIDSGDQAITDQDRQAEVPIQTTRRGLEDLQNLMEVE